MSDCSNISVIERARKLFEILDKDKSGFVEVNELKLFYLFLGQDLTLEQLNKRLLKFDLNSDGKLSFEEVNNLLVGNYYEEGEAVKYLAAREQYKVFFEIIDVDRDGYLTLDELRLFAYLTAEDFEEEQLKKAILKYDADKDGKINLEEAIKFFDQDDGEDDEDD
eukprot:TRINITY_DN953_c0_g5_i2.p1 TRINITY_DN953_c0_g5~~TRINITY_DN953_c0_g5_i2.p1  ORF type:complete len:182 (-),score=68.06 TRINITY_DN953_c0_g5_i2:66-560(-)